MATRDFSDQFAFSLDFWWVYLFYLRALSAPAAMACGAALAAAAAFLGWRLWSEVPVDTGTAA